MFDRLSIFVIAASCAATTFAQAPAHKAVEPLAQSFSLTVAGGDGYLGVQLLEITKENYGKYGLTSVRGAGVERVVENSPAEAAGVKAGDVIVSVNGEEITSARKLNRLIGETAPDHQARITVLRAGAQQDLVATIGKRQGPTFESGSFSWGSPGNKVDLMQLKELPTFKDLPADEMTGQRGFMFRSGGGRQIGVGITPLTKQLAQHFSVDSGVLISSVKDGSPAAKVGLKAGDIIVEVDGIKIASDRDIVAAVNAKKDGDVRIKYQRGSELRSVSLTPETTTDMPFMVRPDNDRSGPLAPSNVLPLTMPGRVM